MSSTNHSADSEMPQIDVLKTNQREVRRNYNCNCCGYNFPQKCDLQNHIKSVHLKENKIHRCESCEYSCASEDALEQHSKSVHGGPRPYECPTCDKKFVQKVHLESHITAVHIMNKSFVCPYQQCGYRGSVKGLLVKHVKTVHLKQKPFNCDQCASSFGQKAHLQKHMITMHILDRHYKCVEPECVYETSVRADLDRHVLIEHRGEKLFQCEVCISSFGQKDSLIKHMRKVHHVNTPYKCVHCSDEFKIAFDLKKHISINHEEFVSPPPVKKAKQQQINGMSSQQQQLIQSIPSPCNVVIHFTFSDPPVDDDNENQNTDDV